MKVPPTSGESATPKNQHVADEIGLVTAEELARKLEICLRTVRRWRAHGLPAHGCGRVVRYDPREVKQWLKVNVCGWRRGRR